MPRRSRSLPKYRKHKASGQAVVTLDGMDFYLGPYNSRASLREYDRLVGEWQQNGRQLPTDSAPLSMAELLNAYRKFASQYYVKDGKPTGAIHGVHAMLKLVRKHYGDTLANDFGPLALKSLQSRMIELNLSRRYLNDHVHRIRRMFKWAAGNELIRFEIYQKLTTVDGLQKGRTKARETAPVLPVGDSTIELTLPHLPPVVADMVRLHRFTGCRPAEVCIIRPCDIDTSGEVWTYRPKSYKTEHLGRYRIIFIGPRAQDVLRPYLLRESTSNCFSPSDSERQRLRDRQERRTTPTNHGNRPGTNRRRRRKRAPGTQYTTDSYRRAVHRACDAAFLAPIALTHEARKAWQRKHHWSPNQIRHTAGTEIRKRFGLEAAQVALGHSSADVTQIYAERDLTKAADVARQVG